VAVVDKTELPQLLETTVTVGAAGYEFGAAVPVPAKLVQPPPFVCVTVYVPAVTVMAEEVAPVLHSKLPVEVVDKIDGPHPLLAVTVGVAGNTVATPLPAGLVHPPED
jgi:hypothetical protein